MHLLRHKAVAYLNLDIVVTGHTVLQAAATPLLHDLLYESAREVSTTLALSGFILISNSVCVDQQA